MGLAVQKHRLVYDKLLYSVTVATFNKFLSPLACHRNLCNRIYSIRWYYYKVIPK